MIPIIKFVTFLEIVPISNLSSTSKIGIQVEPFTHAFKTGESLTINPMEKEIKMCTKENKSWW